MQNFDLKEFSTVSHADWRKKIETDLRGKSMESLFATTLDQIVTQPDYTSENTAEIEVQNFISNAVKQSHTRDNWYINQEFSCRKPKQANPRIIEALNAGVDSIKISVPHDIDFDVLFKDILPEHIEIRFKNASYDLIFNYYQWAEEQGYNTTLFEGTFEVFYHRMESLDERIELAQKVLQYFPKMSLINVNGDNFFNQGSTNVQQLAISIALAHEILAELIENEIAPQDAAKLISFSFATGADYFSEIAKYRAFKALWKIVLAEYGIENHPTHVHGITSTWNQTVQDINNNMLRGSTQALSAILGGCQTVTVTPFDASVRYSTSFSDRMARNTQLILRDEVFAGKVVDPSSGAYYIEQLTEQIVEKTWALFLEIEELGGFQETLKNGIIKGWIEDSKNLAMESVKTGETTILGVNKYPNPDEDAEQLFGEQKKNRIKAERLSTAVSK